MTAFGPFAGTETVSFDELEKAGLFLLTGPTGSGKTTILDAICFALYGKVPRSGNSAPNVASHHRELDTTPSVELEVTIQGRRLKIRRSPSHERPAKRGDGTTTAAQEGVLEEISGADSTVISAKWSEVNSAIEERIGMNAEQFSQVVMLPQGDFARFLKANVNERRALLERLFPTQDLTYVEKWLTAEARRTRDERNLKLGEIRDRLIAAEPSVQGAGGERDDPIGPAPGPDEDKLVRTWIETASTRLEAGRKETEDLEVAASAVATKLETGHASLKARADLVVARGQAEDRLGELEKGVEGRKVLAAEIEAADRATGVALLTAAVTKRDDEAREADTARAELLAAIADPEGSVDTGIPALAGRLEEMNSNVTSMLNFERDVMPRQVELRARIAQLKAEAESLADLTTGAGAELTRAEHVLLLASQQTVAAKERWLQIREARNAGMAAELAVALNPHDPCPVCGSTEHPDPAQHIGEEFFEKKDEDDAELKVAAAEKQEATAKKEHDQISEKIKSRKTVIATELESSEKESQAIYLQEQILTGPTSLIESLSERRETMQGEVKLISGYIEAAATAKTAAEAAATAKQEAEAAAKANGFTGLEQAETARREQSVLGGLKARALKFDEDLAAVQQRLDQGDLNEINRNEVVPVEAALVSLTDARAAHKLALAEFTTARNRATSFAGQTEAVPGLLVELQPLTAQAERAQEVADLAEGRNPRRMQLSIYVLAARLKQVIEAANTRLGPMSNDHYELVYSGDLASHGAASGLGIEIFDNHTSEARGTETLSGGESFYASLSLALGLAEVVQHESGGKKLETLFIDEGFGTLDSATLEQVMDEIDNLREDGRLVGLVSHVEELRNRITTQVRVTPGRDGSHLEVVVS